MRIPATPPQDEEVYLKPSRFILKKHLEVDKELKETASRAGRSYSEKCKENTENAVKRWLENLEKE